MRAAGAESPVRTRSTRRAALAFLLAAWVVCAGLFGVAGSCAPDKRPVAPGAGTSIEEIVADPRRYTGRSLSVSGPVREVYGTGAFTMGRAATLLVLRPRDASPPPALAEGDVVRVDGVVGNFTRAGLLTLEPELGGEGLEAGSGKPDSLEPRPALVADSVTKVR